MRIIDLHSYKGPAAFVVYCGRDMPNRRASPLANPFTPAQHGVQALPMYRQWLGAKMAAKDSAVMDALYGIDDDSILACWCINLEEDLVFTATEVCHCQLIAKAWRWLNPVKGEVPADLEAELIATMAATKALTAEPVVIAAAQAILDDLRAFCRRNREPIARALIADYKVNIPRYAQAMLGQPKTVPTGV